MPSPKVKGQRERRRTALAGKRTARRYRGAAPAPPAVFRTVQPVVWAFDCEWVPCAASGRTLLGLDPETPEADVFRALWDAAGATADRPRPFLPLARCRVASVAVVERRVRRDGNVTVQLCSAPHEPEADEADVVGPFLAGLVRRRPQLVGFHSQASDLPILLQRALVLGIAAPGLCQRPERPWEGPDYTHPYNEWNVDLLRALGGRRGASSVSLSDLAVLCGIPAKAVGDTTLSGSDVADLWLSDRRDEIRHYNEVDAVTTYLLWLRAARMAGLFSVVEHATEEGRVERMLEDAAERGAAHLGAYLDRWRVAMPAGARADTAVR